MFNGFNFKGKKNGFSHERLAYHVIKKGKTITQISFETGVCVGSISSYCSGKIKPSAEKLQAICFAIDIKVSDLYDKKKLLKKAPKKKIAVRKAKI